MRNVKNYKLEVLQAIDTTGSSSNASVQRQEAAWQCPSAVRMLLAEFYMHLSTPIALSLLPGEQEMLDTSTQSPRKVSAQIKSMLWLLPCVPGSCDV